MKLTSIGTVGRLGSPFVFNIPKAKLPQGGQRTVAGPYNCNRINPPYTNGMMGSVQEGAYDPFGSFDGDVGIFGGSSEAGFFEDFSWLENTDDSGGSGDEYTSAQAESVRESTPNQTIEFLKDFSKSSGITDATKNLVNVAVQRGVNEIKEFLVPEDVGKRMIDPYTGKQGTIIKNPNNPNHINELSDSYKALLENNARQEKSKKRARREEGVIFFKKSLVVWEKLVTG